MKDQFKNYDRWKLMNRDDVEEKENNIRKKRFEQEERADYEHDRIKEERFND